MNIGNKQIFLLEYAKKYLRKIESSKIQSHLSSLCYLNSWDKAPGYAKLNLRLNGWLYLFNFFGILIKNILSIASHSNYIKFNNKKLDNNFDILVVSWSFKKNFKLDGSFDDKYFNENSKNLPNSHWFLISMDDYVPQNLNNNITIIKQKKRVFKYDFFTFFWTILKIIINCKFSPRRIFHNLYYTSYFAQKISLIIKKELKKANYKTILLPYEAQPFQNTLIFEAKNLNNKITTIGYLHSLLSPLPCDYIYRSGAPDFLLVHGKSQIEILKSKLNWPKNKLFLIESLRYQLNENRSLSKKIFLSYSNLNKNILIKLFTKLLINLPVNSLPKFEVQNHPAMLSSKEHLNLKIKLEKIMNIYKDRFLNTSSNGNISIFFGATAAIFEALEKGIDVIHICSNPVFESFSEKIWPDLKVIQLNEFTFSYKLVLSGKYINFSKEKKILSEVLKTII